MRQRHVTEITKRKKTERENVHLPWEYKHTKVIKHDNDKSANY